MVITSKRWEFGTPRLAKYHLFLQNHSLQNRVACVVIDLYPKCDHGVFYIHRVLLTSHQEKKRSKIIYGGRVSRLTSGGEMMR